MFQLSLASLQCSVPYFSGPQGIVRTFPVFVGSQVLWMSSCSSTVIDLRDTAVDAE